MKGMLVAGVASLVGAAGVIGLASATGPTPAVQATPVAALAGQQPVIDTGATSTVYPDASISSLAANPATGDDSWGDHHEDHEHGDRDHHDAGWYGEDD